MPGRLVLVWGLSTQVRWEKSIQEGSRAANSLFLSASVLLSFKQA